VRSVFVLAEAELSHVVVYASRQPRMSSSYRAFYLQTRV